MFIKSSTCLRHLKRYTRINFKMHPKILQCKFKTLKICSISEHSVAMPKCMPLTALQCRCLPKCMQQFCTQIVECTISFTIIGTRKTNLISPIKFRSP